VHKGTIKRWIADRGFGFLAASRRGETSFFMRNSSGEYSDELVKLQRLGGASG